MKRLCHAVTARHSLNLPGSFLLDACSDQTLAPFVSANMPSNFLHTAVRTQNAQLHQGPGAQKAITEGLFMRLAMAFKQLN